MSALPRMRTLKEAYSYIKSLDPETNLSYYALTRMVLDNRIPSVRSGKKRLINIDTLDQYLCISESPESIKNGQIRVIPEDMNIV